jgi:hypothetical protein
VHTRRIHRLKGSLRVTEYSGGGTVQRKAQRRNRTTEGSVKLCQEGIEQCKSAPENSISSSERKRSVEEKTLTELLNTL